MAGAGGNGGLTGSVNSTAKTFPDNLRAAATGVVVSGFGLSAFFFSNIARLAFPGDTPSFLSLLTSGTSVPMLLGSFFVCPVPLPPHPHASDEEAHTSQRGEYGAVQDTEERALLSRDEIDMGDVEIAARTLPQRISRRAALKQGLLPNVYGIHLFQSMGLLAVVQYPVSFGWNGLDVHEQHQRHGAGSLYKGLGSFYDPIQAAHWQADQVSAIGLMNCLGRILIGLVSDYR